MNSENDNESKTSEERNEVQIGELKPKMTSLSVVFKIVGISEAREVNSRHIGEVHRVADAIVGDKTGTVKVPLWDASIENIEVGKTYALANGYTGLFRGNLQLKIGPHSTIEKTENEIETVNTDVDMSAENHHPPRDRQYYQPQYSQRGYGGNSYSRRRDSDRYSRRDRFRKRRW